jgi:hypothetical protein
MNQPKYAVGTKYMSRGKCPKLCTVTDILRTYNSANELVRVRYVATHDMLGNTITDHDVAECAVSMGLTP